MNPFSEWQLVWVVVFDRQRCVHDNFWSAFADFRQIKNSGDSVYFYPKLILKGRYHRGLKNFLGW